MKWIGIVGILITGILAFLLLSHYYSPKQSEHTHVNQRGKTVHMKIASTAFADNAAIPAKYSCQGDDVNPPLSFSDVPQNAKSLVLILDDPDAPGGTFTHWVVYNIPPQTTSIDESSTPPGMQAQNSFGKEAYGGPCPPSGTHHYHFKLYALDEQLSFGEPAPGKTAVEKAMQGHIIEQAELIGLFSK